MWKFRVQVNVGLMSLMVVVLVCVAVPRSVRLVSIAFMWVAFMAEKMKGHIQ